MGPKILSLKKNGDKMDIILVLRQNNEDKRKKDRNTIIHDLKQIGKIMSQMNF